MEEKCIKTPVFTVETVLSDSAEVPIDIEFNLPDYCPEVSRILKCRAIARVSSKSVSGRSVSVDGSVTVTVIYADGDNMISSYEYQYPISKSFDAGAEIEGAFVLAKAKCEYINCRAVTERKIDIHGAAGINILAFRRQSMDIICDIENDSIELLHESVPVTVPVANAEKYLLLDEEIEVGNSQPDIKWLIRYDASVTVDECKLLADKAIIKGSVAVNLLYRDSEGQTQSLNTSIPVSQLLEAPGADENCTCEASGYIAYLEIKPKTGADGTARGFSLDGKLLLSVQVLRNDEARVITDAYSRRFEAQITGEEVDLSRAVVVLNDTFTCKERVDLPADGISGITDIWCEIKNESARADGECLIVSGTAAVGIIAADGSGTLSYFEKPIDFEYNFKLPVSGDCSGAEPSVSVISANYTLTGDNTMEIRLEMAVNTTVYEHKRVSLVSDIRINANKPAEASNRAAMTVYFAGADESVWDISRRYLASVSEVKRLNGIEDDILASGRMILLPSP